MKAFGYIRVSTEEQSKGFSLEYQEKAIREYCRNHNIELIQVFEDHTSGADYDRPELQDMLKKLDYVDAVIVWKMDRLSRSVRDTIKLMGIFEEKGKELISITEPFLSVKGNSQSKLMIHIFSSFAQYERDLIRERTIVGKLQKAKKGLIPSGKAPYGYKYENHTFKIIPEEAEVVKIIFNKYLELKSIKLLVQFLNKESYKPRQSTKWRKSTVLQILKNPIYKGSYIYNRRTNQKGRWLKPQDEWITIENKDWAIIDEDTFEKVQEILKLNMPKKEGTSNRYGTGRALFGGLIKCGVCGSNYLVHRTEIGKKHTVKYYCGSINNYEYCGNEYVYDSFLEEAVIELLEHLASMSKEEIYSHILEELQKDEDNLKLKRIEEKEKKLTTIIENFTQEFERFVIEGLPVPQTLKGKLVQYERELFELKLEKEKILKEQKKKQKQFIQWQEFIEMLEDLKILLEISNFQEKKLLYKSLIDQIIAYPDKIIAYVKGKEFELNYRPRILTLTEEERQMLKQINSLRSKIILMAEQTYDRNKISQALNVDFYTIDYCIKAWKKGEISALRKNEPLSFKKSKVFNLVKEYIEKNNIDINKITNKKLQEKIKKDLNIKLNLSTIGTYVNYLGKKRKKKF